MNFSATEIDYADTGYFTRIIEAYLSGDESLKAFYNHRRGLKV